MKKLSKLMALLLALVLVFGTMASAVAEGIQTVDEYLQSAKNALQRVIMGVATYSEYKTLVELIEDEHFDTFYYEYLTEEEQNAMSVFLEEKFWEACISYNRVAPFMTDEYFATFGIVNKSIGYGLTSKSDNGLTLNKTVVKKDEDTYRLRLEAYATGAKVTTTTTTTKPCDIVLVLDLSSSMTKNKFGSDTRLAALKTAVKTFITSTAAKYDETKSDHRIYIIGYNATNSLPVNTGWTYVDSNGSTSLQNTVTNMGTATGTRTDQGLSAANTALGNADSTYTGNNTDRQKVVVLFTDGVPTINNDFNESYAVSCITTAKTLKETATVYSVAIYDGVSPLDTINTSATTDDDKINAMLHAISSNYLTATASYSGNTLNVNLGSLNPKADNDGDGVLEDGEDSYYLTADSPEDLNNIFQSIASQVQTGGSSSTLTEEAVLVDYVTENFTVPDGAANLTIYTADYIGANQWGSDVQVSDESGITGTFVEETVNGEKVEYLKVNGFNYSENWCGTETTDGTVVYRGKKLIVEFDIDVREGFLGGNGVTTNDDGSGVYANSTAETPIEEFVSPAVNVPIDAIVTVTTPDKNVYLYDDVAYTELESILEISVGDVTLDMDAENYGLADWQYAYVTLGDTADTLTEFTNLIGDETYSVTVTVAPNTTGDPSLPGTVATTQTGTATGKINVYKPYVTFKDSSIDYGTTGVADTYYGTNNYVSVEWKHGTTAATSAMGDAPALTYTYSPAVSGWAPSGTVTALEDQPVNVTVYMDVDGTAKDVTGDVTGTRKKCECTGLHVACDHTTSDTTAAAMGNDPDFVVHITNVVGDLNITKILKDSTFTEGSKTFTFTIEPQDGQSIVDAKKTATVTVVADPNANSETATITIEDLVVGKYKITETAVDGYTTTYDPTSQEVTVVVGTPAEITVTNTAVGTIDVEVQKIWDDENNRYGLRPADTTGVAVELRANGATATKANDTSFAAAITLTKEADEWYYKWTGMDKFDANGVEIDYTVVETPVANYQEPVYSTEESTAETETKRWLVTNTLKRTELTINKIWDEKAYTYATGDVESAMVSVTGTGAEYTVVLTQGNGYTVTITNLPVGLTLNLAELTGWNWRYTTTGPDSITLVENATSNVATFNNNVNNDSWLGGDNYTTNVFNAN